MSLIRRGTAKRKHEARRAWLSARLALHADVPGIHDDVTDAGHVALDRLQQQMCTLGLLGKTSQRETIRRLVSELRGESVGVGW